jgi:hypothetical protein
LDNCKVVYWFTLCMLNLCNGLALLCLCFLNTLLQIQEFKLFWNLSNFNSCTYSLTDCINNSTFVWSFWSSRWHGTRWVLRFFYPTFFSSIFLFPFVSLRLFEKWICNWNQIFSSNKIAFKPYLINYSFDIIRLRKQVVWKFSNTCLHLKYNISHLKFLFWLQTALLLILSLSSECLNIKVWNTFFLQTFSEIDKINLYVYHSFYERKVSYDIKQHIYRCNGYVSKTRQDKCLSKIFCFWLLCLAVK